METLAIGLLSASLKKPQSAGASRLSQFSQWPRLRAVVHVGVGKGNYQGLVNPRGARRGHWKRGLIGSFHQVSVKHLDRYVQEFRYHFNNRRNQELSPSRLPPSCSAYRFPTRS